MAGLKNRFTMRQAWRLALIFAAATFGGSAYAIDPPYQKEMERLTEVLGSLYFLQPLCTVEVEDWRAQAAELIALDNPDDDRRQRLIGEFNTGYESYARVYRSCTPSANEAMIRLLVEAEKSAREIRERFAE